MATGVKAYYDHWYEVVDRPPFRQGDIVRNVVVFWLREDLSAPNPDAVSTQGAQIDAKWLRGDWILLDASCDLDQRVCPQVLVAPVEMATHQTLKAPDEKQFKQRLEVMRRGGYPTRFLLSDHPKLSPPLAPSFVDFRHHLVLPIEYLERNAGGAILRLKSPMRELFGNWVGACISRVGPETEASIPAFTPALHDAQRLQAAALEDEGPLTPPAAVPRAGLLASLKKRGKRFFGR